MEEKSRAQELSVREISLIRELAQIRKEHKRELEYEKFDGYELPPRTQFSMLNKPAVSIKYGVLLYWMSSNGKQALLQYRFRNVKNLKIYLRQIYRKAEGGLVLGGVFGAAGFVCSVDFHVLCPFCVGV